MKHKMLLAVGKKSYSDILKETLEKHPEHFTLSAQEVLHRRFLEEILDIEKPDFLIIHDYYLESDYSEQEQRDQELAKLFRLARVNYDDSLRIVFLCERPKGDPFLSSLVSMGILDIFNKNSFDLDEFIDQLLDKPRFSRVEKFLLTSAPLVQASMEAAEDKEDDEEEVAAAAAPVSGNSSEGESRVKRKERQVKVVEKKVIQKTINKNVVKRDYKIQILNTTEKIVGVPLKKKLIMIGNLAPRSGSTFISHLLARGLSDMGIETTYIESPFSKAYTFDRFIGHQRTQNYYSLFHHYRKELVGEQPPIEPWQLEGVELICKNSINEMAYKDEQVPFESFIKILFSTTSIATIVDVGSDWQHELFQDVFDIADHAYFVLEPDLPYIQYLEESKDEGLLKLNSMLQHDKSFLIGNKFHQKIEAHSLMRNMYEDKLLSSFPVLDAFDVFQAQYKGLFLNDFKDYSKRTAACLTPLYEDILPEEFIKKQHGKSAFIKGLFKKKINVEKTEIKGEKQNA